MSMEESQNEKKSPEISPQAGQTPEVSPPQTSQSPDDAQAGADSQPDEPPLDIPDQPIEPRPMDAWDLQDAESVIALFRLGAQANLNTVGRVGCCQELGDVGRLVMTGDLHDNGPNLERILKLADLAASEHHHVILHEIVHGPRMIANMDLSIRMLARVAAIKCRYPHQVHLMMGNHEWAQFMRSGILKRGTDVVEAYTAGVEYLFGNEATAVMEAMDLFIRTMLLAVRCDNGIMCCHSLPSPRMIDTFDDTILKRVPRLNDFQRFGPVYAVTWGRKHNEYVAEEMCDAWDVDLFIMGHQPAEHGYDIEGPNMLILASDHDLGVAIPIDLSRSYAMDDLLADMVQLATVE